MQLIYWLYLAMQTNCKQQNGLTTILVKACSLICAIAFSLGMTACGDKKTSASAASTSAVPAENLQKPKVVSSTLLPPMAMDMYMSVGKLFVKSIAPNGDVTIRTEPTISSLQPPAHVLAGFSGTERMQEGDHWVYVSARLPIKVEGHLKIGEEVILHQQSEEQVLESGEVRRVVVKFTARDLDSVVPSYPRDFKPDEED